MKSGHSTLKLEKLLRMFSNKMRKENYIANVPYDKVSHAKIEAKFALQHVNKLACS